MQEVSYSIKKNIINHLILILPLFLTISCAPSIEMHRYRPLTSILKAYKEQGMAIEKALKNSNRAGIKKIEVIKKANDFWVNVDIEKASLFIVIKDILNKTKLPYIFKEKVSGNITANFNSTSLLNALNMLLSAKGLIATQKEGQIIIEAENLKKKSSNLAKSKLPFTYMEIPLYYIDTTTAANLLDGLYPQDSDGKRSVEFGVIAGLNSIFLYGPIDKVYLAERILNEADRKLPHVIIECLVVEFDLDAFEQIGVDISNSAFGSWNNVASNIGGAITSQGTIHFTYASKSRYDSTFTAIIDALISENKGRIVSRPYIAALSGETASINIIRDRYIVTQEVESGTALTTTRPISSGIKLDITPTVMADGLIKMIISVEDSQFLDTEGKVVSEVDANQASTIMQVRNGQSIIIGGLTRNIRTLENVGLPWLRNLPLLNWIFSKPGETLSKQEVMLYVTPYIWDPTINLPLPAQNALSIKRKDIQSNFFKK